MGLRLLPLWPGSKVAAITGWRTTENHVEEWFEWDRNLGLRTGSVIGVDFDKKAHFLEFQKRHPELCQCVSVTRKGAHVLFQNTGPEVRNRQGTTFDGIPSDVRGEGGYLTIPASRVAGHRYRYLDRWLGDVRRLPELRHELLAPERKADQVRKPERPVVSSTVESMRRIHRAKMYGVQVRCVEHRGAHNTFYRFCCWMRDVPKLTRWEAETVIREWNFTNCF